MSWTILKKYKKDSFSEFETFTVGLTNIFCGYETAKLQWGRGHKDENMCTLQLKLFSKEVGHVTGGKGTPCAFSSSHSFAVHHSRWLYFFLCRVWSGGLLPSAKYTLYLLQIHFLKEFPFLLPTFAIIHIIVDVGMLFWSWPLITTQILHLFAHVLSHQCDHQKSAKLPRYCYLVSLFFKNKRCRGCYFH